MDTQSLVGELFMKTAGIKEALVLAFNPPPIFGLGTAGGFELYIQNRGEGGAQRLNEVAQQFIAKANADPLLMNIATFWRAGTPQLYVDVDREKAKALGVSIDDAFATLVGDARQLLRQRLQQIRPHLAGADVGASRLQDASRRHRQHPRAFGQGDMIPLSAIATVNYTAGPDTQDRFNNLPAVKIFGSGKPGVSSGQAIERVEQIAG